MLSNDRRKAPPRNGSLPAPSLKAFLGLGLRPLYLAGTAWALIAIAIWIYAPQCPSGPLHGIPWHAHEMLWGFIPTIAVGFLMTAGANWTGVNPLQVGALGIACARWLIVGLAVADALYLISARDGDYALLIARRVIPFFAMSTLRGLKIPLRTRAGQVQLARPLSVSC